MMETFLFSSPKFLSYAYIILAPDYTFDLGTIANVGIPADTSMSCGFSRTVIKCELQKYYTYS